MGRKMAPATPCSPQAFSSLRRTSSGSVGAILPTYTVVCAFGPLDSPDCCLALLGGGGAAQELLQGAGARSHVLQQRQGGIQHSRPGPIEAGRHRLLVAH